MEAMPAQQHESEPESTHIHCCGPLPETTADAASGRLGVASAATCRQFFGTDVKSNRPGANCTHCSLFLHITAGL